MIGRRCLMSHVCLLMRLIETSKPKKSKMPLSAIFGRRRTMQWVIEKNKKLSHTLPQNLYHLIPID